MIELRRRTPEETKAYIDGYNACFKRFCECLENRKSVLDSVKRMKVFVDVVNGVVMRGEQDETD